MKKNLSIFLLSFALLLSSCSTTKRVTKNKMNASEKSVVKKYDKTAANFESAQGKIRTHYQSEDEDQSITVSFRIKKDQAIWMSAKIAGLIPLAKVMIEPDRVRYYEKIHGTYFDGNFSLLSKWLGTQLDFQKVQNLLLGRTIYSLREGNYTMETTDRGYQFTSVESEPLFKSFLLNSENFRTEAQQLVREAKKQSVTVLYPAYQTLSGFVFPKEIEIIANQKDKNTQINIRYRSVSFDQPVSFPFHIPSGYKEIEIK